MMMNGTGMMIWGIFSFRSSLVLIALCVALVVLAVKWLWGENTAFFLRGNENPLDILKKRYARGEISKEEFERIRKDIE